MSLLYVANSTREGPGWPGGPGRGTRQHLRFHNRSDRMAAAFQLREPTTRAGIPTAIADAGIDSRTTAAAPMTAPSPMVTPSRIFAPAPTHTPSPIATPAEVRDCSSTGFDGSEKS